MINSSPTSTMKTAAWQVELLGGLRVQPAANPANQAAAEAAITHFRSRQAGALLAFLSFHRGQAFSRGALIEMLWPGCEAKAGRNRLSVALSSLRGQFPTPDELFQMSGSDNITLRAEVMTTDVAAFEDALRHAAKDPQNARVSLAQALSLYRGSLLPGYDEEWIAPEARRLEDAFFRAARRLMALHAGAGERNRALAIAQRAVSIDPSREEVQRELIRLLAQTGQLEAARRQGLEVERALREQSGASPDATTRALLRDLEARAQTRVRQTKSGSSGGVINRPRPLTRFFGREDDLQRLQAWMPQHEARLLTLTGPGGSGKTRLVVEAALQLEQVSSSENATQGATSTESAPLKALFSGGAWFVALAETDDAALLPQTLRDALHLPPAPGVEPLEQLVEVLSGEAALLILDNFEQVLPQGASLVQSLLERLPALKILVTSRRTLSLAGEREHIVAPLPLPAEFDAAFHATPFAAAQLFVDRAQTVRPDFQLQPANARDIHTLCRSLDAIPLAIELAAARAGVLSPAQIVAHLDEKLDLLTSEQAGIPERHRTLRAAIDWSFRLLPRELQRFWTQLSVFRGGCTLEAVQAVCGGKGALDALSQLRGHSLLTVEERYGVMRFGMLETLREFASEQGTLDERSQAARRHAEYYACLAEAAEAELYGPEQELWLQRLNEESANWREALNWASQHDWLLALRLAGAMVGYWKTRGLYTEGKMGLHSLLQAAPDDEAGDFLGQSARAKALLGYARLQYLDGDLSGARPSFEACLTLQRQLENPSGIAAALGGLGWILIQHGEDGRPLLEESLSLFAQSGATDGLADALFALASASQWRDVGVRQQAQQFLRTFRERGDLQSSVITLSTLGTMAFFSGEAGAAKTLLEEGLEIARRLGKVWDLTLALWILGSIARGGKDFQTARAHYHESLTIMRRAGKWPVPLLLQSLGALCADEGAPARAVTLLSAAQTAWPPEMHTSDAISAERDHYLASLRTQLPADEWQQAWSNGQHISLDGAIALALQPLIDSE